MVIEWPILRSAATRALSRKQFPQNIAPAPGVSWIIFILLFARLLRSEHKSGPTAIQSFAHLVRSSIGLNLATELLRLQDQDPIVMRTQRGLTTPLPGIAGTNFGQSFFLPGCGIKVS